MAEKKVTSSLDLSEALQMAAEGVVQDEMSDDEAKAREWFYPKRVANYFFKEAVAA